MHRGRRRRARVRGSQAGDDAVRVPMGVRSIPRSCDLIPAFLGWDTVRDFFVGVARRSEWCGIAAAKTMDPHYNVAPK